MTGQERLTGREQPGDAVVAVVGIGIDGPDGLSPAAIAELSTAEVLFGSGRQLELIPTALTGSAERISWPSPLLPALPELLERQAGRRTVVLASGDPMFFGIGSTLVGLLGSERVRVFAQPSSVSLACARLGWPVDQTEVISTLGRDLAAVGLAVQPGQRLMVLAADGNCASELAELLIEAGYRDSRLEVLEQLGGPAEHRRSGTAAGWRGQQHDRLAIVAIHCVLEADRQPLSRVPGLPEDAFDTDGQITKRELRALALSALAPLPGQLLWDVGAGSGSIGIEWMRSHRRCRAIAIEPRADRCERIALNRRRLGVPELRIVTGSAPEALAGLPQPDAIFLGGGVSVAGVLDSCLDALPAGGRLAAHAVTLESEQLLLASYQRLGGSLTQIAISRAAPIGGFTGWSPARPIVAWSYRKPQS